jgi:hypothetical protein
MKNLSHQGLNWLVACVFIAAVAYVYLHLQSAKAERINAVYASRFELINGYPDVGHQPFELREPLGLNHITDDPNVRKCICKLWQKGGYGFLPTEAGMDIARSKDGSLSCRFWPFAHLYQRAAPPDKWPLDDVAAVAHTHPRKGAVQYPSDPDDYMSTLDDYVVCADGVFSAGKGCTNKKDKKQCTQRPGGSKWYKEWCE